MPSSTSLHGSSETHECRRRVVALWTGVFAGPLVWLALLEWSFVMFRQPCETGGIWWRHVPIAAGLLVVALAGAWAWRAGHGSAGLSGADTPPIGVETTDLRSRWMAWAAAALAVSFCLLILSLEVPVFVLRGCA